MVIFLGYIKNIAIEKYFSNIYFNENRDKLKIVYIYICCNKDLTLIFSI